MLQIEMNDSYTARIRWNQRGFLTLPISLMIFATLVLATFAVHAQSPDFTLNSTPAVLCVNPGVDAVSVISVQSVGGFAGTVNLGDSIGPTMSNGPTLSAIPSSVTLAADQSTSFNLMISTTTSTPLYTYTITVSGLHGATIHQTTIQLTVAAGCSVGGTVLPSAGLAPITSYLAYGAAITGLAGILGVGLAIYVGRRKPAPTA
jgi:hypothetical protein